MFWDFTHMPYVLSDQTTVQQLLSLPSAVFTEFSRGVQSFTVWPALHVQCLNGCFAEKWGKHVGNSHRTTVPLYHSSTTAVPQYHSDTVSQQTTVPQYHWSTVPQYHCSTVSEFYSTTLPEYHSIKVPEYHHIIPHYTTIKEYQSTREPQNVGNSHAHVHNRPKLQRVFSFKTLSHHLDYTAGSSSSFLPRLQSFTCGNSYFCLKLKIMFKSNDSILGIDSPHCPDLFPFEQISLQIFKWEKSSLLTRKTVSYAGWKCAEGRSW